MKHMFSFLPTDLEKRNGCFAILVDRAGEPCERMMIEDIGKILQEHDISCRTFPLSDSVQDACIIVSESWESAVGAAL